MASISKPKIPKLWGKIREANVPSQKKKKTAWTDLIVEMERMAIQQAKENRIKIYDLSTTLPKKLYKRVSRIVPMIPIEKDLFERDLKDEKIEEELIPETEETQEDDFKESEYREILRQEQAFDEPEIKDEPTLKRPTKTKKTNWQSPFVVRKQNERIKWNSKLYQLERNVWEKPLYEQAEDLMDSAAERFSNWVNSLGSNKESDISKELLKSLFSIEESSKHLHGIQIDSKSIKAVPGEVATTWGVPEMAIEKKLTNKIKQRKFKIQKGEPVKVAFGRTLPQHLRTWTPSDADVLIQPVFPEELRTREVLFEGIGHLRSTKALIRYYEENPNLERPTYLVEKGWFNQTTKDVTKQDIPLYELLNIKKQDSWI